MAIPTQRRIIPRETRLFGSGREQHPIPNLTMIQTDSYAAFLQEDLSAEKRKDHGLESVLKEIFPVESYDKQIKLEYLRYELGKPRYTPEECRQLRPHTRLETAAAKSGGNRVSRFRHGGS